jgi:putative NADH-flavin reductase
MPILQKTSSMIITVFGASGQVGKQVVAQALAAGHTVRAFGRNVVDLIDTDLHNNSLTAIKGYVLDADDVAQALKGADVVISVLGGSFDGLDQTRSKGMQMIVQQMVHANIQRIAALGGLGILPDEAGGYLLDAPDYPQQYLPVGREHQAAYETLKASTLDWTFVCSPNILDRPFTGQYITKAEAMPVPNHYEINAGDLADCLVHAISSNTYLLQRVGISRL